MKKLEQLIFLAETGGFECPEIHSEKEVNLWLQHFNKEIRGKLSNNERDRIHHPPLTEILKLENGSCIWGIDYREIPGNSAKVIPVDYMFKQAEERGEISPEKTPTLIMHSSGNASIWFTKIAKQKGYKRIIVVTMDYISTQRMNEITAYGAEVHFVPGEEGIEAMITKAEELESSIPNSKFLDQTFSHENYKSFIPQGKRAAMELLRRKIKPSHFLAGVGTGGTFTGLLEGIRQVVPKCEGIAVEIAEKPFLANNYRKQYIDLPDDGLHLLNDELTKDEYWLENYTGASQVPGLAANMAGENLIKHFKEKTAKIITIPNETGTKTTRLLAKKYGQYVGPSTGTTFAAAYSIAVANPNSTILLPVCDSGARYENELWYKQKRKITELNITENLIGSSIKVEDIVHPEQRTQHLNPNEIGGPCSSGALLHFMEIVCHDLEKELGLISVTANSLGAAFGPWRHRTPLFMGNKIFAEASLISIKKSNENLLIEYKITLHTLNGNNQMVPIIDQNKQELSINHTRCLKSNIRNFKKSSLPLITINTNVNKEKSK